MDAQPAAALAYDVFISYSMDPDYALSRRVESFLEGFHTLKLPNGQALKHLQICRDGSDFSMHKIKAGAPALAQGEDSVTQVLVEYLAQSNYLLVLCSPNAAKSKYVAFEVDWFIRHKGADRVLVAVTDGADLSGNIDYLFPQPVLASQLHQRIFYDLRGSKSQSKSWPKVRDYEEELTKLAAHLSGRTPGEILPTWRQEEKRKLRRQRYLAGVVGLVLLGAAVGLSFLWRQAEASKAEAFTQRNNAQKQLAQNFWNSGRTALAGNQVVDYLHLVGQALNSTTDDSLTQSLLTDAQSALPTYRLAAHIEEAIEGAVLSPDQRQVLGWGPAGAQVWDVASGRPAGKRIKPEQRLPDSVVYQHGVDARDLTVRGAAFNHDGSQLLVWNNQHARLWRVSGAPAGPSLRHDENIVGAAFSHDEQQIVSWGAHSIRRWASGTGVSIGPPLEADRFSGRGAVFSPDDKQLLTYSGEGFRVWQLATGRSFSGELQATHGAAFSRDGQRVLAWGIIGSQWWQASTGQVLGPLMRQHMLMGAAASPNESRVLSWGNDGVHIWVGPAWERLSQSGPPNKTPDAGVQGALLSQDEERVLSWGNDKVQLQPVAIRNAYPMSHPQVQGAVLSPDESRILSWGNDGTVRVWEAATGQLLAVLHHQRAVSGAAFVGGARRVMSWGPDGIRLWRAAAGEPPTGRPMPHLAASPGATSDLSQVLWLVPGAVFSHDNRRILSWSTDGLRLWDASTQDSLVPLMRPRAFVNQAVFSPDDQQLMSWGAKTIQRWNTATGRPAGPPIYHGDYVGGAAFDQRGRRILSWGGGAIRLWQAATGQPLGPAMVQKGVREAMFNRSEGRLLAWGNDGDEGLIQLWDVAKGTPIGAPLRIAGTINAVAWSPDESRVVATGDNKATWLGHLPSRRLRSLEQKEFLIDGAKFSRDGKLILTWGDGGIQLWRAATGKPAGALLRHEACTGAAFSRNGQRLLSWGNQKMQLWQAASGRPITVAMSHESLQGAAFSPREDQVLSWGVDGSVRRWLAATGQPLGTPVQYGTKVEDATFDAAEGHVLFWGAEGPRLWDVRADLDLPPSLFEKQVQALTGTVLDANALTANCCPLAEWRKINEAYQRQGRAHYQQCRFKAANVWHRYYAFTPAAPITKRTE
ncbi:TIR domain-containing protein [Hymenobacter convexus]|uniref:TIR domain-containing protein n=1 Tax=Hymenobacter sp. CA1UV-4 TaxID=3063782 RepID=UPI0027132C91|nr:TIR domain-containing protein [Hymenobacter sp. CA1UV-4]MDO7854077.1 TIR domain-containing protein [Hymenobacter sp. CA1UV-4]